MRSAPNSVACANAYAKAFSFAGTSEAKRMVDGLLHPGFKRIGIQTSYRADINDNRLLASTEVRALTLSCDPNHPTESYPFTSKFTPTSLPGGGYFVNLDLP